MRKATEITKETDLNELKRRENASRDPRERRRIMGMRLKVEGYSVKEIMRILPVTQSGLLRWVKKYNEKGFEGLKSKKPPGRARYLSEKQLAIVREWLDYGPEEHHGCRFWTGKKLIEAIEKEFGITYALNGIYDLLKKLGYSRKVVKTRHYKSDPEREEEFKKNFRQWSRQ